MKSVSPGSTLPPGKATWPLWRSPGCSVRWMYKISKISVFDDFEDCEEFGELRLFR